MCLAVCKLMSAIPIIQLYSIATLLCLWDRVGNQIAIEVLKWSDFRKLQILRLSGHSLGVHQT